ncbi:MAG: DUF1492 domain-containing protein [Clostridiales bacterium]|nr:DUF1492 domain-containing protein [Clostridiales bacterium]
MPELIAKKRLQRYKYLKRELENQQDRLAKMRSALESAPKLPDGMPRSNYAVDRMAEGVVRVNAYERKVKASIKRLEKETMLIEDAIQRLKDPQEREILRLRYLEALDWWEVAEKVSYSISWIYTLHGKALLHLKQQKTC